ncbi:hypothetical protein GCM10011380_05610 [Sphingomonas metalli]|uniref:Uncharacterized protein n=1 Tax=Sphingomonas metalli TaxID=1779358 RepID=A0A916SVM3_9SPHN|nr:hypothetical protein [Sphingomonas metalli]GGB18930.1 hypothetical protein GCM10011380_05610 [Sphingomonas metalli]
MSPDPRLSYRAFLSVVAATLIVALAPIVVSGILGKSLPEALIATSDKVTTGLVTLLGTIGGLMFRQVPPSDPGRPQ